MDILPSTALVLVFAHFTFGSHFLINSSEGTTDATPKTGAETKGIYW